jgi:hypothetical protein
MRIRLHDFSTLKENMLLGGHTRGGELVVSTRVEYASIIHSSDVHVELG